MNVTPAEDLRVVLYEGPGAKSLERQRRYELLSGLLEAGQVTAASARQIFFEMARTGERPEAIMRASSLEAVSDLDELERIARAVIEENPGQVEKYRGGQQKIFNFFVGQVMKATQGKASPDGVREILSRLLAS